MRGRPVVNQIEQRFYVIIRYTDGDCDLETEGPMNENEAYALSLIHI